MFNSGIIITSLVSILSPNVMIQHVVPLSINSDQIFEINSTGESITYNDTIILANDIEEDLKTRYGILDGSKVVGSEFTVLDIYGENPRELDTETYKYILSDNRDKFGPITEIGCGPLALLSQFFYLVEVCDYFEFVDEYDYAKNIEDFVVSILENVITISAEGTAESIPFFGQEIVDLLGAEGTLTIPEFMALGANAIFEIYGVEQQLSVDASYFLPTQDKQARINRIVNSLNAGMPVIMWEQVSLNSGHYINIYGYETWRGINSNGQSQDVFYFIANPNWNYSQPIYINADRLESSFIGVITFAENFSHLSVHPDDYGFPCSYNNTENLKTISLDNPFNISLTTKRLRTGYVNHYDSTNNTIDDQRLVLSSKRGTHSQAYLTYEFNKKLRMVHVEVVPWSIVELFYLNSNCSLKFFAYSVTGGWDELYSVHRESLDYISFPQVHEYLLEFPSNKNYTSFKIEVNNPVSVSNNDRNYGRMIVKDMHFFFERGS